MNFNNLNLPSQPRCSFCGKMVPEIERLFGSGGGPAAGVFICNECVELCYELLEQERAAEMMAEGGEEFFLENIPSPRQMKAFLDEYVIGQDYAKQVLSVAVYNHYKRINSREKSEVELDKSNILLIGPTGCGKTLLAQTLARILDVPFCIVDATPLTQAGYVGEDVENILLRLIQVADYDIARAQKGIIYIDEIDKINSKGADNPSITRDVTGEGVQQALLKIIEGTLANVPPQGGRKHPHQEFLQIDTSNILFICGGAFFGLQEIVEKRLGTRNPYGFMAASEDEGRDYNWDEDDIAASLIADDLIKFGLMPEFVGRLPIVSSVRQLDEAAMLRILTEPKNALVKQYQYLFKLDGVELTFTPEALKSIAQKAMINKTGARSLRGLIEKLLLPVMFEIPSSNEIASVTITAGVVDGTENPELINKKGHPVAWVDGKPALNTAA